MTRKVCWVNFKIMTDQVKKHIKNDPEIKGGMPVIAGTRVTVSEIISFLENEKTVDSVIRNLKQAGVIVTREEVFAALEYAKYSSSSHLILER